MVYLYLLKNISGRYYIGITKLDLNERLKRHNAGDVMSTKPYRPWELFYFEAYDSYKEARVHEKQIKSWKGGNAFKNFLKDINKNN
ncbi:GIY-YIG nuclease family protein [Patescibacteria group bacterium]|nr:GIY-YIG nuclease family protein [Patescibacteria group bacterium]